ncbi:hypothetical protein QE152_g40104 [Popillia japonica]|uniref:Transposase n=1 Tax=Popillia japonica TaxID=7064 RepID=A0AAW1HSF9_POPJA
MNSDDTLLKNLPRTGRRRRFTAETTNEITEYINANPLSTATKIKAELNLEGVSNSTIIRALHTTVSKTSQKTGINRRECYCQIKALHGKT